MKKLIYLLPILGLFLLASCEIKTVISSMTTTSNQRTTSTDNSTFTTGTTPIKSNETSSTTSSESKNNELIKSTSDESKPSNDEYKEYTTTSATGEISNGGSAEDDGEEWHRI